LSQHWRSSELNVHTLPTGWPDWAKFRLLGDCLLWAGFLKITEVPSPNFCPHSSTKYVNFVLILQKMCLATFWAIFFKISSFHPDYQMPLLLIRVTWHRFFGMAQNLSSKTKFAHLPLINMLYTYNYVFLFKKIVPLSTKGVTFNRTFRAKHFWNTNCNGGMVCIVAYPLVLSSHAKVCLWAIKLNHVIAKDGSYEVVKSS
jgi:hypothetical protein